METNEYRKMFEFENDYWWYRGLHELVLHYVAKFKKAKPAEELKILDAGCGTGRLMELLDKYGTVEGMDYSEQTISFCRQRGLTQAKLGDLNTWEPPAGAYHIITSNDVIYHAGVKDDMAVVRKFYQALKEDGILILNLPAFELLRRKHDIAVSGQRRYRKKNTLQQLKKIGFTPVYAGYRLPPLFLVLLAQKHLVEPFSKVTIESDLKPLPRFINSSLLGMHRLENKWITTGIRLPFGSSLFLVCKREIKK